MPKTISVFPGLREPYTAQNRHKDHRFADSPSMSRMGIGAESVHPAIRKLDECAIPDEIAAKILDISHYELERSKCNPVEARQYITFEKILNLCHELGIHPAALVEMSDDIMCATPTAIIEANIWVSQASGYGEQDRSTALAALEWEQDRFKAFMDDPLYGRLGEEIVETLNGLAPTVRNNLLTTLLPYHSQQLFHYLFDHHDEDLAKRKDGMKFARESVERYVLQTSVNMLCLAEKHFGHRFDNGKSSIFGHLEKIVEQEIPEEHQVNKELAFMLKDQILQDLNTIYSVSRVRNRKALQEFLLQDDLQALVKSYLEYAQAKRNAPARLEAIKKTEELIDDSINVMRQWRSVVSSPDSSSSYFVRVLEQLFANNVIIRQALKQTDTLEVRAQSVWNSITASPS